MVYQYVSCVMREEDFAALFQNKSAIPGQQVQKYHRLLIEGIAANGIPVEVISGIPVTHHNYQKKYYSGKKCEEGGVRYHYLHTINFPLLRNIHKLLGAFLSVMKSDRGERKVVICDVLNISVALGAAIAAKIRHKPCIGIVTDLPSFMGWKNSTAKMVDRIIGLCSHYIILTEQMNKEINPTGKPALIIEGIADKKMQSMEKDYRKEGDIKKCLYAGTLAEQYGVKTMVNGFILANVTNAELHIYGDGPYAEELKKVVSQYKNIIYHGTVLNEEVVQAELEATLLINPRPTHEEFTKYSFPSKNIEYMSSGTAVLTTNLPGMPKEYHNYVYIMEDESEQGMCESFHKLLALPVDELNDKGMASKKFVQREKNNIVQARRLIQFMNGT